MLAREAVAGEPAVGAQVRRHPVAELQVRRAGADDEARNVGVEEAWREHEAAAGERALRRPERRARDRRDAIAVDRDVVELGGDLRAAQVVDAGDDDVVLRRRRAGAAREDRQRRERAPPRRARRPPRHRARARVERRARPAAPAHADRRRTRASDSEHYEPPISIAGAPARNGVIASKSSAKSSGVVTSWPPAYQ